MKNVFLFVTVFITVVACSTPDERNAEALAERIVPGYDIEFVQLDDTVDVFELETVAGRFVIRGNNANSMAVGLNHYLKNYCDVTVSWFAYDPVQYPARMPQGWIDSQVELQKKILERERSLNMRPVLSVLRLIRFML